MQIRREIRSGSRNDARERPLGGEGGAHFYHLTFHRPDNSLSFVTRSSRASRSSASRERKRRVTTNKQDRGGSTAAGGNDDDDDERRPEDAAVASPG